MSCTRFDADLVDRARGEPFTGERASALERHVRECTRCSVRLQREHALSAALRRLLDDTITPSVDPVQVQQLLAAFDARLSPAPSQTSTWPVCAGALLVVAATLMWMVAYRARSSAPHSPPAAVTASPSVGARLEAEGAAPEAHSTHLAKGARPRRLNAAHPVEEGTGFVILPGVDDLPQFESGELMRVELPTSVVASLGLRPPRPHDGFTQTDVLVGQDGYARAVRLVR